MKKAGINLRLACERMCRVFGYQIFQSGFVHADPHPGNLFVRKMPNNDIQLVLLDHGLYQYVEPQVQVSRIWKLIFLVGAFLEKRVDYSHGFSSVFFDTPEMTKIVLPNALQNFKLYLLAHETERKNFFLVFRVTFNIGRD